jgi:ligand-binding sensor domain-containing protein/anti-sigma regulatory factor (Ser/Thr protein kinase)
MYNGHTQNAGYIFRHISTADGLINNKVTAIYNDSEGYMWIGTQAGLQRFDGTRFKNFLADIRDTTALQTDWISSIFEDRKKRLWIGTDLEGPYLFNQNAGKFYNFNLHASLSNKIDGMWHFAEDSTGVIWIAGHRGYYRLNEKTMQFENYTAKLGLGNQTNTGILSIDRDNNFWLSTARGLEMYNTKDHSLYNRSNNPGHNPLFDIKEDILYILHSGNEIWATTGRQVYRYNFIKRSLKVFSFDTPDAKPGHRKQAISGLFRLQDGKIIASLMLRGIAIFQPATDDFIILNADNASPYGFHMNKFIEENVCLMEDRENSIVIGNGSGLNISNPGKQFFKTHKRDINKGDLFPETTVNDFLELPDGNILAGYYDISGGIVKMDPAFHFQKHFLLNDAIAYNAGVNQVWSLFRDAEGIVWAPNQRRTILKLNPATGKLWEETDSSLALITIIRQDADGTIWMGYWRNGLAKKTGHDKPVFFDKFLYADANNIKRVQCLLPEDDKIWVGTLQNGLQVFDKKTEKFVEAFQFDLKNNKSISSNCVTDILRYNTDTLIVATLMGINIFDEKKKVFTAITAKQGLPNNLVQTIIKDEYGHIWAACFDNGFFKLDMHNLSVTRYGLYDGITDNLFTSRFYRLKDGRILIGASSSFISFDPSAFAVSAPPADVHITSLLVFQKELMTDSLVKERKALSLSYNDNSLRITFASLQLWNSGGMKYYYKLDGIDKEWVLADESHTAIYNQLKPGSYTFNVKCANRDGIFSINTTQLKIRIETPFWKSIWFLLLVSVILAIIVFLFIKGREKNFKAVAVAKLKVQQLNAEKYKTRFELEQIINYFSSSLINKNKVDDVLWDVAKNLIGRLGFEDCMIYLWNDDKTRMIQKAGFGPKDTAEAISSQSFDVLPGQGVVGYVMETREAVMIADTSIDKRYRADDQVRSSEISVPIIYNDELIGVIDSEHHQKNFFTTQHLQILNTIATLIANKIKSIEVEQSLQQTQIEMYSMNEQLSKAKLEALRSQMNPHFIFNSLNAIQECILTNKVDAAYEYLSKFSKLQRMVLNNSEKELIPLSSEIEMLQLYLSLESLRFSKTFTYSVNADGVSDPDDIIIPSLITQPLVENAIWHGLRSKDGEKILSITCKEKDGTICITIEDNGIGRDKSAEIKTKNLGNFEYASRGTTMMQQRLQVLSQQLNADIQLVTLDKKDEQGNACGTKVILSFPADLETTGLNFK